MAREVARIARIAEKLEIVWFDHPNWRLGQLMENIFGCVNDGTNWCVFYREDEEVEAVLDHWIDGN